MTMSHLVMSDSKERPPICSSARCGIAPRGLSAPTRLPRLSWRRARARALRARVGTGAAACARAERRTTQTEALTLTRGNVLCKTQTTPTATSRTRGRAPSWQLPRRAAAASPLRRAALTTPQQCSAPCRCAALRLAARARRADGGRRGDGRAQPPRPSGACAAAPAPNALSASFARCCVARSPRAALQAVAAADAELQRESYVASTRPGPATVFVSQVRPNMRLAPSCALL